MTPTTTKIETVTVETARTTGNILGAGTYSVEMPSDHDPEAVTGEDILLDGNLCIVDEDRVVEAKLEIITTALNADTNDDTIDRCAYNHWERFEVLCNQHGLTVDDERQDRLGAGAAYDLFTEDGYDLCLSSGEWAVTETEEGEIKHETANGLGQAGINAALEGWAEGSWADQHDALCSAAMVDPENDDTIQCYTEGEDNDGGRWAIVWWCGNDAWTMVKSL